MTEEDDALEAWAREQAARLPPFTSAQIAEAARWAARLDARRAAEAA